MPNRIIKESFFTDDRVASLSDFAFRVWIGLMATADGYGSGDARSKIIKGRLFPLDEDVRSDDVSLALQMIDDADLIEFSYRDNKLIYTLVDWAFFQPDEGRRTKEYKEWRDAVFRRDNYTCRRCGQRGGALHAHHILRYRDHAEGRTDIDNGITLCSECHKIVHHEEGR